MALFGIGSSLKSESLKISSFTPPSIANLSCDARNFFYSGLLLIWDEFMPDSVSRFLSVLLFCEQTPGEDALLWAINIALKKNFRKSFQFLLTFDFDARSIFVRVTNASDRRKSDRSSTLRTGYCRDAIASFEGSKSSKMIGRANHEFRSQRSELLRSKDPRRSN